MAAKFTFELNKFLECPICMDESKDPRVLPCLHSLCKDCLRAYITQSAIGNHFNCPACRRSCQLPAGGVAALPRNFMLNSLKELLKRSQTEAAGSDEKPQQICSNSNKGDLQHTFPTVFCVNCAEFYCSNCEYFHKMFGVSSKHRLRPARDIGLMDVLAAESKKQRLNCDRHPSQSLDLFCDTCKVPICGTCCHLTHRNHDYRDLVEVGAESNLNLSFSRWKATQIEARLNKHVRLLNISKSEIQKEGDKMCLELRKAADELRDEITRQEQFLVQKILDSQKAAATDVEAAYKEAEINKVAALSLESYIQALQTSGDVIDQVTHSPGVQEQLQQLEAVPLHSVKWSVSLERESQSLSDMLGSVKIDKTVVPSGVIDDTIQIFGDPILCLKPDVGMICRDRGYRVSGLVVIGDCIYVTGNGGPYLWIHNMRKNIEKQHRIKDMEATGMAVVHNNTDSNNNTLVITDFYNKLRFVTISAEDMNITGHTVKDIPFYPRHVSVDSAKGKLIIANYTDAGVTVCDSTGEIENTVPIKATMKYRYTWCALATDDGYIVLDYYDPGRAHWMTKEGDVTHTYGIPDSELLSLPEHMTTDSNGLLLVTDCRNSRVHLIDAKRQLSSYLFEDDDDIQAPSFVYLDETTRRLFVGHSDQHDATSISVFDWPYTPGTNHNIHANLKRYHQPRSAK